MFDFAEREGRYRRQGILRSETKGVVVELFIDALFVALLWIPTLFLDFYLSVVCPGILVPFFLVPVLCGIGMSLLLLSKKGRYALGKGVVAFLFSVVPWRIFVRENFIDRVLQHLDRDYDGLSAGGRFGMFYIICIFAAVGGISMLVGVSWSTCDDERPNELFVKRGKIVARVLGGIVFAYMMLWLTMLPEYVKILG